MFLSVTHFSQIIFFAYWFRVRLVEILEIIHIINQFRWLFWLYQNARLILQNSWVKGTLSIWRFLNNLYVLPIIIKRGRRLFSLLNCNRLVPKPPTPSSLPARLDCCKFLSAVWTPVRSTPFPGETLNRFVWLYEIWARKDSNLQPSGYEPPAPPLSYRPFRS